MKINKRTFLIVILLLLSSSSYSSVVHASDSETTAREAAQDATESEWNAMKSYFSNREVAKEEGYSIGTQIPPDFQYDCNEWQRNEYAYTGPAKRIIKSITSSDPNTVEVSFFTNNILLKRGKGNATKVTINIQYQLDWAFHVKEDVLGVWWDVNDCFGPSGVLTDSFTVKVEKRRLEIIPKAYNQIELNMFKPIQNELLGFVDISSNFGEVTGYMKQKPDDSKLGKTFGEFIFSDLENSIPVTIPFMVVDTVPPNILTKNMIVDYGNDIKEEDFILSAMDNDFENPITYTFNTNKGVPNTKQVGKQEVDIVASDASGNITNVSAELMVNNDLTAPTAEGILQVIPVQGSLPQDPLTILKNIRDNDDLSSITASYLYLPDTSKIGLTFSSVKLCDKNGNSNIISVPVYVHGKNTICDSKYALEADNFTVHENQIVAEKIDDLVLEKSNARAMNMITGKDVTQEIKVVDQNIKPKFGSYQAKLKIGDATKEISVHVLDNKELIDMTIPKEIIFGSTDIHEKTVVSPIYTIKNNSKAGVRIVLDEIKVADDTEVELVDKSDISGKKLGEKITLELETRKEFSNKRIELNTNNKNYDLGILNENEEGLFKLSGKYYGAYKGSSCKFRMIFKFEII